MFRRKNIDLQKDVRFVINDNVKIIKYAIYGVFYKK